MSDDTPSYPDGFERHYGRRVWAIGEDGDEVVVEGHDRRSVAALNAYVRGEGYGAPSSVEARWMTVETVCGCTASEHEQHVADDTDCVEACEDYGLPPCRDDYGWCAAWVAESTPAALPVMAGSWR